MLAVMIRVLACSALLLPPAGCVGQTDRAAAPVAPPARAPQSSRDPGSAAALTLEQIMAHPDWIGNAPERPYWSDDGRSIYYSVKRAGSDARDLTHLDLDGGPPRVVPDSEKGLADVDGGAWSADYSRKVYTRAGDLFLKEIASGKVLQLTRTSEAEFDPRFMLADRRIAFRRAGTIFIRDLDTGTESQPADLQAADDPDKKKDEDAAYLKSQQERLFDIVKERKRRQGEAKEREKAERDADPTRAPRPRYLGADMEVRDSSLSPDGRWMLVRLAKTGSPEGRRDAMPQYVSETGYVESRQVRPKVGTGKPAGEALVLLDLEKRERKDLDLAGLPGIADDPLKPLREAAEWRGKSRKEAREWLKQPPADSPGGRTADPDLKRARWLIENESTGAAKDLLTRWIDSHAGHPDLALAYRLRADATTLDGEPYIALYDYERITKEYAASPQFALVVEREVEIGTRLVKIDGMRRERAEEYDPRDAAAELLIRAQERLPGSKTAERAAVALGDWYFDNREFDLALTQYNILVRYFPESADAPRVRERLVQLEKGEHPKETRKADKKDEKPKPRPAVVRDIEWSEDGSRVVVQVFSMDNKDRWIAAVDLAAGALVPLERDTDDAWINGRFTSLGWLKDNRTIWFLSERTGYSHLYLRDAAGGTSQDSGPATQDSGNGADSATPESSVVSPARALTEGEFEVDDVRLSRDGKRFFYSANTRHPGEYETWALGVETGEAQQLTALHGVTDFVLSPDSRHLMLFHSTATRPPELFVLATEPGGAPRRLTSCVSETFTGIPWIEPEYVEVPGRAGVIHARLYLPPSSAPPHRSTSGTSAAAAPPPHARPAVLFIHGAGYLQNAHKGWSRYFREMMFHNLLAQRGYVVLDMDFRASSGYGRQWRTAIYRGMGTPEVEDLEDGVGWLVKHHNVDPARVGCYGGSYGGFLTLMALFTKPDLFACGAALRPVTDWAHYSDGYTANILNTPDIDPESYERSSPIEFAAGLKKPLLICHGMQDDNVFFQDTVRLAQRLIELGKKDWEVAMYPIEPHAFTEPASWLDEYRRILKLFETNLHTRDR